MAAATEKLSPPEKRYRIGDRVKFLFPDRVIEGTVVEDRGPIGPGGKRLYRVEWPSHSGEPHAIELSVEDFLGQQGAVDLGGIFFTGPCRAPAELPSGPGVYVVLDNRAGQRALIDVGLAANMRDRVQNHDRQDCWKRHVKGTMEFAAYCTAADAELHRRLVEEWLRAKFAPPCGER